MQDEQSSGGLTVRAVAGSYNVLIALDLTEAARQGCLGFSIQRTQVGVAGSERWLPNMLHFPNDSVAGLATSVRAPLQVFRWGDYTAKPGTAYQYRVVPRYGSPSEILAGGDGSATEPAGGVTVTVTTEPEDAHGSFIFFNRGAAASNAYVTKFGDADPQSAPGALAWLSRGLIEGIIAFLERASGPGHALHAVIYEFQKPELLQALAAAKARGADVRVVYHARVKGPAALKADLTERRETAQSIAAAAGPAATADDDDDEAGGTDHTRLKNEQAIADANLVQILGAGALTARSAPPQGAIMHDKYVVHLEGGVPQAILTGSTNWTDGAIYGQLNVAHIVNDPAIAAIYEQSFQLLARNPGAKATKAANAAITPIPANVAAIPKGTTPVFSPQDTLAMIDLYAEICKRARLLFVSAPFLLHQQIRDALNSPSNGALRYVLGDKQGSFGKKGAIEVMNGDPGRVGVVATMLGTKLNDFQGRLLEKTESFHHAGVHVHSKVILADPFSDDPILVCGSANFSKGSTTVNDSNSLIVRGRSGVIDIYATEFMRMFQHYWFRFRVKEEADKGEGHALGLDPTTAWQDQFYDPAHTEFRARTIFVS